MDSTLQSLINLRNIVRAMLLADLEYQEEIDRYTKEIRSTKTDKLKKTLFNSLSNVQQNYEDHKKVMSDFNSKRGNFLEFIPELCEGTNEGKRKALMYLLTLLPETEEMRDG